MRERRIKTSITGDEWFISLTMEEQRFFLQLLITEKAEMSGIFYYPDREMIFDMPFFSLERITFLKKKLESDQKVFFKDGWVWLSNFGKNNNFYSPQQRAGIACQLLDLKRKNGDIISYFEQKGFSMAGIQEYADQRRRNKVKRQIRKVKPHLFGQQLETEVDRIIGISDSGSMDWAEIAKPKEESKFPTPESIGPKEIREVCNEYRMIPYVLYWVYSQRLDRLRSSGRKKHDYYAYLREVAATSSSTKLEHKEIVTAYMKYHNEMLLESISRVDAEIAVVSGK